MGYHPVPLQLNWDFFFICKLLRIDTLYSVVTFFPVDIFHCLWEYQILFALETPSLLLPTHKPPSKI